MVTVFLITLFVCGSIAESHANDLVLRSSPANLTVMYEPMLGSVLPKENLSLSTDWINDAETTLCYYANQANVSSFVLNALAKGYDGWNWVVIVQDHANGYAGDDRGRQGEVFEWANICKKYMYVWRYPVAKRKCSFTEKLAAKGILSTVGPTIYSPSTIVTMMDTGEGILNLQHYLIAAWNGTSVQQYSTNIQSGCAVYSSYLNALYFIRPASELECYFGREDKIESVGCDYFIPNPVGEILCFIGYEGSQLNRQCVDSAYAEENGFPVPGEDGSSCVVEEVDSVNRTTCLCAWDNCNVDFETAASDAGQSAFFLPMAAAIIFFYLL